jgi:hypothetical protein
LPHAPFLLAEKATFLMLLCVFSLRHITVMSETIYRVLEDVGTTEVVGEASNEQGK